MRFTTEPLAEILPRLRHALAAAGRVSFEVPDPDLGLGLYAGELTPAGRYRPLGCWVDLADLLGAHLLLPERVGGELVRLTLVQAQVRPIPDSYDALSEWQRIQKLEDPTTLHALIEALRRVDPPHGGRVLALGVNSGQELGALALAFPERAFDIVGLDISASALALAARQFPHATFTELDAMTLPRPELGQFDLVLSLSLLQSPSIRQDVLLKALVRHHLTPTGGLILGYPNARYRDGYLSYGARLRNFERPDLSLLCADVTEARRGLHKYGYKVFVTGKYEVLVTAIPMQKTTPTQLELE